jgi:hypothetical protein
MGYFAQLDDTDTVQKVIRIENDVLGEDMLAFPDTEPVGRAFIANTLGLSGEWRQTSFNASFRYNYAGIAYTFDASKGEHGAFIAPQPFPSWTLDADCKWQPPTPMPDDGGIYAWNEEAQEWQAVETE